MYRTCRTAAAAFNRGNLTFWRYQKLSRTNSVQDKREYRKCEHFLSHSKCSKCLPLDFTYSLNLFLKRGPASAKIYMSSPLQLFNSKTVFWLQIKLSKSFVHPSEDRISAGGSNFGVRWSLLRLNHLQSASMQVLLSDTCCVCRAPCNSLNLQWCTIPQQSSINLESRNF